MALRLPPSFLGKAGVLHPAQNDRLTILSAMFRPATAQTATSKPLTVTSGAIAGPAGTMGELTLVNPTTLRVNPARFVVQGTQNDLQGAYEVTNDALVDLGVTARHSSQYRRSLAVAYVRDSSVAGGANDDAVLTTIDGALSATTGGAALPSGAALPPNLLALGELFIPPTTDAGAVTLTPYNPRTGMRHGILPVIADGASYPGHDNVPPAFDGEYRHHPSRGLQVGEGGEWRPGGPRLPYCQLTQTAGQSITANTWVDVYLQAETFDPWGMHSTAAGQDHKVTVTDRGVYRVSGGVPYSPPTNNRIGVRFTRGGVALPQGAGMSYMSGGGGVPHFVAGGPTLVQCSAGDVLTMQTVTTQTTSTTVAPDSRAWFLVEAVELN